MKSCVLYEWLNTEFIIFKNTLLELYDQIQLQGTKRTRCNIEINLISILAKKQKYTCNQNKSTACGCQRSGVIGNQKFLHADEDDADHDNADAMLITIQQLYFLKTKNSLIHCNFLVL